MKINNRKYSALLKCSAYLMGSLSVGGVIGYGLVFYICGSVYLAREIGFLFGSVTGLTFGLVTVYSCRNIGLVRALMFMLIPTLLFSIVPMLMLGENGIPIAWLFGMVGYWIGYACLMIKNLIRLETEKIVPEKRSES